MKRLKDSGLGIVKRVEQILFNEENFWSNNVLGSTSPQVLLNTVIQCMELILHYGVAKVHQIHRKCI